jgi:hypothetical protein
MFEEYLLEDSFNLEVFLSDKNIFDKVKFMKDFEALKHNAI